MNINQINLEQDILNEIQGTPNGAGFDISLTKIYDQIKDARFEEDENLSQGIWERELKKADWIEVQRLAIDAIKNHSKDFQIIAWLIESLAIQNGFIGIANGIRILTEFTKKYYETGYPRTEENGSDEEQKLRILDWIYQTLAMRSKLIPIIKTDDSGSINLYNYEYAADLKKTINRSPNNSKFILDSAKRNNIKTLEEIQKATGLMDGSEKSNIFNILNDIKHECKVFKDTLQILPINEDIGDPFHELLDNLQKIIMFFRLENIESSVDDVANESAGTVIQKPADKPIQSSREELYDQLNTLAERLSSIDRHSPSPHLIKLVVSWQNKSLLEIAEDLKNGASESHKLLKFLIG